MAVELEHGARDPQADVTGVAVTSAKIAWAHLKEVTDSYTRVAAMKVEVAGTP